MNILYIATSFPEVEKGSTIYTDLAEGLFNKGHKIDVVVTEQSKNMKKTTLGKERGFDVLRVVVGDYYDVNYFRKGVTTLKMPFLIKYGIQKYFSDRQYDFILFEAPPVTNGSLVAWAKKKFLCPAYLMLKDIFPQNAVDLGVIKKKGIIYHYFAYKEMKLLKVADHIGAMSEANRQYIISNSPKINADKIEIFPNTKKLTNDFIDIANETRDKYSVPRDACVFLFGGNMGKPQYIELLCHVIEECRNDENIFFLFVGRGTDRYKLENIINENKINNALVLENLPRDEYDQITKSSDVGLIVLNPNFTIPNYPSRILSYMEYAKPVLAATDKITDLKQLIEEAKCGNWVWSGDKSAFVQAVREMAADNQISEMGYNGRSYVEENFTIKKSVGILENHFNKGMEQVDV